MVVFLNNCFRRFLQKKGLIVVTTFYIDVRVMGRNIIAFKNDRVTKKQMIRVGELIKLMCDRIKSSKYHKDY